MLTLLLDRGADPNRIDWVSLSVVTVNKQVTEEFQAFILSSDVHFVLSRVAMCLSF